MADDQHIPVLRAEVLRYLAPERGGCFVDCTLGLGGHAEAVLEASPDVQLIGLDRDPEALAIAAHRLAPFGNRAVVIQGRFGDVADHLAKRGIDRADGVLADLGVSSLQLDRAGRGFAFSQDGPLDMRMEGRDGTGRTAEAIVNSEPEDVLTKILKDYGEEPQARRIARAIVDARVEQPFERTAELRTLVERTKSYRPGTRRRKNPATQVFQALRIEVNEELEELKSLVGQASDLLAEDGRMVVISYHSLEDRIVKNAFRDLATGEIDRITGRPHAETQVIDVLTRKPVRPRDEEVIANPRARSARLRAGRRIGTSTRR